MSKKQEPEVQEEMTMEDLVPQGEDGWKGETKDVVIRKVEMAVGDDNQPQLHIWMDPVDVKTGEIKFEAKYPEKINVKKDADGKFKKSSLWGIWMNEKLPNLQNADGEIVSCVPKKTPKELEGCIFTMEKQAVDGWSKNKEGKTIQKWFPIKIWGRYEQMFN